MRRVTFFVLSFVLLLSSVPMLSCRPFDALSPSDSSPEVHVPDIRSGSDVTEDPEIREGDLYLVVFSGSPAEGESEADFFGRMLDALSERLGRTVSGRCGKTDEGLSVSLRLNPLEVRRVGGLSVVSRIVREESVDSPSPVRETVREQEQ